MAKNTYKKWMVALVNLDPTVGVEIRKTRPCLIISPDAANKNLHTVVIAPLTSTIRNIPTRLLVNFDNQPGEICFDQIKAIDITRIIKALGNIDPAYRKSITQILLTMFGDNE
jgi:mRNA interferase MazF